MSPDPALGAALAAVAEGAVGFEIVGTVHPTRVRAGAAPACDVLLVADAPGLEAAHWAGEAAAACPRAAIVLLVEDDGVETYRAALAAGARAVVSLPPTASRLAIAVSDAARAGGIGRPARTAGSAVAVAAARGGSGASVVALGLGLLGNGLVIDASGSRAGLATALGARPMRSLADLADAGEAISAGIDAVASEHPAGLRLVAGPPDPDLLTVLAPGWGTALVREARASARLTIIDVGAAPPGPAREALVAADRILVVVTPDPRSVHAARALVSAAAGWGGHGAVELVVNRWSRRADLSLRSVSRQAGAPVAAVVRDDRRRMAAYDAARVDLAGWARGGALAGLAGLAGELAG